MTDKGSDVRLNRRNYVNKMSDILNVTRMFTRQSSL